MPRAALLVVAATVAVALLVAPHPAVAVLCSDPPFGDDYLYLVNQVSACGSVTGVVIKQSMTAAQRSTVCTQCTWLANSAAAKLFPNCSVTDDDGAVTTAAAYYGSLFACSTNASTTAAPAGTRVSPSLSPSPSSRSKGSSGSSSHTLDSDAPTVDATSSSNSTVLALAIGGAALIVLVVTVVVGRRLLQRSRAKWVEVMLSPSPHARLSLTTATGTDGVSVPSAGQGTDQQSTQLQSSSSGLIPQRGPWDDEVIIAARVPKDKVQSETLLSRGGFGEVYRGTYNGKVVAIKTLLPATRKDLAHIEGFFAEVKLMATLEHERIVTFIGVAWDSLSDVCVLSEFMDGGDLRGLLVQYECVGRSHGFDVDKIRIATHIAHALTYLHSLQPIVLHRDLKSKNILLDNQLNAKLTDFGISRERSDTATMTAGVGTSLWMAPEVMLGERYDEKSDIFSFGVVLSELDSHALPYADAKAASESEHHRLPDTAILQLVSLGRLSVQFSPHADPKIVALAKACVSLDPDARPSAADALYKLHTALRAA